MFAYKYPKIDVDDSAYIILLSLIGVRIFYLFIFFGKLMDCRSVAFHFKTFLTTNYLLFKTVCNKLC